jgi:hypothetical protein
MLSYTFVARFSVKYRHKFTLKDIIEYAVFFYYIKWTHNSLSLSVVLVRKRKKTEITAVGIRCADHATPSIS